MHHLIEEENRNLHGNWVRDYHALKWWETLLMCATCRHANHVADITQQLRLLQAYN